MMAIIRRPYVTVMALHARAAGFVEIRSSSVVGVRRFSGSRIDLDGEDRVQLGGSGVFGLMTTDAYYR